MSENTDIRGGGYRGIPSLAAPGWTAGTKLRTRFPASPPAQREMGPPVKVAAPPIRRRIAPPSRLRNPHDSALRRQHDTLLKELRLAEQVQRSILPRSLPSLPGLRFGASLRPSLHLAGDFYNVTRLDRDHVNLYLGDVMGHGPAAALLSVFAMQGLRTKRIEGTSYEILPPSEVLAGLNHDLIQADFPDSPFVTMVYGVLDITQRVFTYSCGGHPPATLLRRDQPPQSLDGHSPLLGVFDVPFTQDQIQLLPGDRVVLFSDGVELILWGDFGLGVKGLCHLLELRDGRSPQELIDEAMAIAVPAEGPSDDLTLVMLEIGD